MARRPNLKVPGRTATGRQWRTIEALRSDGWFVLEADPSLWSDDEAARVAKALAEREAVAEGYSLREIGAAAGLSHTAVKFIAHGRPPKP
jgi:hypothetical protein